MYMLRESVILEADFKLRIQYFCIQYFNSVWASELSYAYATIESVILEADFKLRVQYF